jgi:U1 small nuclear ribonucleoprotein
MTDKLPLGLLNLFAPRPPLRWTAPPMDHAPEKRQTANIGGIGQFMQALKDYKDNDGYVPSDSWLQKRDRRRQEAKDYKETLEAKAAAECTTSLLCLHPSRCAKHNQGLYRC